MPGARAMLPDQRSNGNYRTRMVLFKANLVKKKLPCPSPDPTRLDVDALVFRSSLNLRNALTHSIKIVRRNSATALVPMFYRTLSHSKHEKVELGM